MPGIVAAGDLAPTGSANGKKTRNANAKNGDKDNAASQESDSFYKMYNKEIKVN